MSEGVQFDEAWSRRVEAAYITPDIVAQREASSACSIYSLASVR
jgi:hypothetical protein